MKNIYLALLHSLGFTHKKLHVIFQYDKNYEEFYKKLKDYDLSKFGIRKTEREKISKNYVKLTLSSLESTLQERQVQVVSCNDEEYPESLKNIANPPYLFYLRGKLSHTPKIGVVGSRKITSYGEKVIKHVVPEVSEYFEIVSGGAYGCDTEAHKSSLEAGNITVAVIGTSIMEDYPVGNEGLYNNMIKSGGAVVSIFPIGVPGSAYNFPIRNEVVVGLSNGILVIEAQERSGSLITAQLALDLGKDLFAIPGDIYKQNSIGCNNLIKTGQAKLTTCSQDILEEYNVSSAAKNDSTLNNRESKVEISFDDEVEKSIYDALMLEGLSSDGLVQKLNLDISTVSFKLSLLEVKGIIQKNVGGKYELK